MYSAGEELVSVVEKRSDANNLFEKRIHGFYVSGLDYLLSTLQALIEVVSFRRDGTQIVLIGPSLLCLRCYGQAPLHVSSSCFLGQPVN